MREDLLFARQPPSHLGHHPLLNLVILREAEDLLLSLLLLLSLPSRPSTLPTMRDHEYFVYIIASRSRNIYTGITNNLLVRMRQHREGKANSFTKKYKIHRLVYYERFQYTNNAIAREKYLKHCTRDEKVALIEAANPTWEDLAAKYLPPFPPAR
jgi:putative endonuclease